MNKYPDEVYRGINPNDENSWGMCCSYEMACRCAEEHYDMERKERREFWGFILKSLIISGAVIIGLCILNGGL